jgi:hypothetical protein
LEDSCIFTFDNDSRNLKNSPVDYNHFNSIVSYLRKAYLTIKIPDTKANDNKGGAVQSEQQKKDEEAKRIAKIISEKEEISYSSLSRFGDMGTSKKNESDYVFSNLPPVKLTRMKPTSFLLKKFCTPSSIVKELFNGALIRIDMNKTYLTLVNDPEDKDWKF